MRVSMERKPHMYTTWFGLGREKQWGDEIEVTVLFSEEEKEIIKRGNLYDYMVYEHPSDLANYQSREENYRIQRSKMSVFGAVFDELTTSNPRYVYSRTVQHFLEKPTHAFNPALQDEFSIRQVGKDVEYNLQRLKKLIDVVVDEHISHPTGKKTFEL